MAEDQEEETQITVHHPFAEAESQLSSIVYDMSRQVQMAMENMLKMTSEIDQSSAGIIEEIAQCKDSANERKKRKGFRKLRLQ